MTYPGEQVPRLFLSYARHEYDEVRHLAQVMRKAGFAPFLDEAGLEGGHPWWDQLLLQIKHCDAFVPVLSRHYLDSVPCRREAEWAEALNKPVLPIMIEQIDPAACAEYIARSQFVVFTESTEDSLLVLTRALWKLPPCPPLPEVLPAAPKVPISPVNALVASVSQRLDANDDLSRADQMVLLGDLKSLYAKSPDAARTLLARLQSRDEVTASVHAEISSLLSAAPSTPPVEQRSTRVDELPAAETTAPAAPRAPAPDLPSPAMPRLSIGQNLLSGARWLVVVLCIVFAIVCANEIKSPYGGTSTKTQYGVGAFVLVALACSLVWWDWKIRRRARS